MQLLTFFVYLFIFSIILRYFYFFQRKIFEKSYYSFYELITGLPPRLSFSQLFLIRFLPPFLVTFFAYKILNYYFDYNFTYYSLIGAVAALVNIVPSIIEVKTYKGQNNDKLNLKKNVSSLYLIYFFYFISFVFISGLGGYVASIFLSFSFLSMLPSQQGIVDTLWITLIILIINKLNKPL